MTKIFMTTAAVATLALGACSKATEDNAANAVGGAYNDTAATMSEGVNDVDAATDDMMNGAENTMDDIGNDTESAADRMRSATGNAMRDAGNEVDGR